MEWKIFMFERLAIQTDEMVFLPEKAGKLIHDAALHTHILMLRSLTDLG